MVCVTLQISNILWQLLNLKTQLFLCTIDNTYIFSFFIDPPNIKFCSRGAGFSYGPQGELSSHRFRASSVTPGECWDSTLRWAIITSIFLQIHHVQISLFFILWRSEM
jgi:hypothetical protein